MQRTDILLSNNNINIQEKEPFIAVITGPTNAGKTSICQSIARRFDSLFDIAAAAEGDHYYKEKTEEEKKDIYNLNFELASRIEYDNMIRNCYNFKKKKKIKHPLYTYGPNAKPNQFTDVDTSKYSVLIASALHFSPEETGYDHSSNIVDAIYNIKVNKDVVAQRRRNGAAIKEEDMEECEHRIKDHIIPELEKRDQIYDKDKNIITIVDNSTLEQLYSGIKVVEGEIMNSIIHKYNEKYGHYPIRKTPPLMISCIGQTGSGKTQAVTTVATNLSSQQNKISVTDDLHKEMINSTENSIAFVGLDNYYKPRNQQIKGPDGLINYDSPEAYDIEAFNRDLERAKKGLPVRERIYDKGTGTVTEGAVRTDLLCADVILSEGILLCKESGVKMGVFDKNFGINTPIEESIKYRYERDKNRGTGIPEDKKGPYEKNCIIPSSKIITKAIQQVSNYSRDEIAQKISAYINHTIHYSKITNPKRPGSNILKGKTKRTPSAMGRISLDKISKEKARKDWQRFKKPTKIEGIPIELEDVTLTL